MQNKTIPIFYTIDEYYAPLVAISLASLIKHANINNNYVINIIYRDLKNETLEKIKKLETKNVKIRTFDIEKKIKPIEKKLESKLSKTKFPISVYFRLFLPTMFPEYDKGLYIDSDTVLNRDVAKLFNYNLEDNLIGAVRESSVTGIPDFVEYIEKAVGVPYDKYVNSGVLLFNMKRLREIRFEDHFLDLLIKHDFDVVAPDQDYLNAICQGKITYLPYTWNVMPVEGNEEISDPDLIHYNLFTKPWHYKVIYDSYFWKYVKDSSFKDTIEEEQKRFTNELRENDKIILNEMLNQAKKITKNDITFNSINKEVIINDNWWQ